MTATSKALEQDQQLYLGFSGYHRDLYEVAVIGHIIWNREDPEHCIQVVWSIRQFAVIAQDVSRNALSREL